LADVTADSHRTSKPS